MLHEDRVEKSHGASEEHILSLDHPDDGEAVSAPHNKVTDLYPYIFSSDYKIQWIGEDEEGFIVALLKTKEEKDSAQVWRLFNKIEVSYSDSSGKEEKFSDVQESDYKSILDL